MGGFCYSNSKILEKSQEDFIKSRLSPLPKKSQFFNEYYTLNDDDVIAISTTKNCRTNRKITWKIRWKLTSDLKLM